MLPVKIALIYSEKKLSGILTKIFTGSYCYHVGWVDSDTDSFYDMHLIRRRRSWSEYSNEKTVRIANSPIAITRDFLEYKLSTDKATYGWKDYLLFALRPLFHLVGKSTVNAGGVICSEMIYNDLRECGWYRHFPEVPSPADLEKELL